MAEVIYLRGGEILPPESPPSSARSKPAKAKQPKKPKPARKAKPKPKPASRPKQAKKKPGLRKVLEHMAGSSWPLLALLLLGGGGPRAAAPGGAPRRGPLEKGAQAVLKWIPLVKEYTRGTPVPPGIVLAIIQHESGGLPTAKNHNANGSIDWGLMQLNDITLKTYGITPAQALDPGVNIATGVELLTGLYQRWKDWRYAIAAYAAGSGAIQKTYPNLSPRLNTWVKYVLDRMGQYGV